MLPHSKNVINSEMYAAVFLPFMLPPFLQNRPRNGICHGDVYVLL